MTEKEALRRLEIHKSWGLSNRLNEAMCVATQALKEIQQYRELGTVEECREAREKQKAKKPIIGADFMVGSDDNGEPIWKHDYICPECGLGIAGEYICCPYCGTYIDWSEEE